MTRRVDDVPRTRGHYLLDWQLKRDAAKLATRQEPTMDAATYAMTPAGRRHLRGIPCVGTGGLDSRRDPLLEVLDRERDAEREFGASRLVACEWGSLRICDQGAHVDEHEDGTISVLERLITKSGAAWTLHRGQWEETDA